MAKRYDQMEALVAQARPELIVEVGVHRGVRAAKLCRWAIESHCEPVNYTGYDVFDTMDQAFHVAALNGKGEPDREAAEGRLVSVARGGRLSWAFVIGDTRQTLHGTTVVCDFAFIDGDHRVEAIRGDAAALDCPVMVFDDYYLSGPGGELPDLSMYGANAVVDEYQAAGASVELLPNRDRCDHGAYAVLAVVRR